MQLMQVLPLSIVATGHILMTDVAIITKLNETRYICYKMHFSGNACNQQQFQNQGIYL